MHYYAERNERRSRHHALVLAIALHIALAAVLYLYTGDNPDAQSDNSAIVNVEKQTPGHSTRTVTAP